MSEPTGSHPQLVRRDFLFGAVAGGTAVGAGWLATYNPWKAHEHGTTCFSQCGEDLIIASILQMLSIQKPTYLDIGAFLPIRSNNTYLLYLAGGHGVLVEPNVDLTDELRRVRPRDTTLPIGIGFSDKEETLDYFRLNVPQLNTFDKERADEMVKRGEAKLIEVVKTRLVPVNQIFAEHFAGSAPDCLSIDVEGLDFLILKSIDFAKHRPKVICVEAGTPVGQNLSPEILDFMKSKEYAVRGMTYANAIFLDNKVIEAITGGAPHPR